MRSKITSPQTLAACAAHAIAHAIAEGRNQVTDLERQVTDLDATIAKVGSNASDLDRQAQALLAAHNELQADDIIAGDQPRPMSREDAEIVRKARQMAGSTPAALEKLKRERSDLLERLIEAKAAHAGAVFAYVRQRQKAAQQTITDALAAIAPELADLLALNAVQRRYCGGERTMKLEPGEAPPFSGDVVVKNFIDRLPLNFKSCAIELLRLTEQSSESVKKFVADIEGSV